MRVRNLKAVVAGVLAAASLGAVSAHAEGLYVGGSPGTPRYPNVAIGISGNGSSLSGELFGCCPLTSNLDTLGGDFGVRFGF